MLQQVIMNTLETNKKASREMEIFNTEIKHIKNANFELKKTKI